MTKGDFIVRFAKPADYKFIVTLISGELGRRSPDQWLKLWKWRYDDNPARQPDLPGFIVGELDKKIVGAHGIMPLRIKIGKDTINIACLSDFAVDPSARSRGYGKKIRTKVLSKEISPFTISTSSNRIGNKVTLSLGGREVPSGRLKFIRPLRLRKFIKRYGARKKGPIGLLTNSFFGDAIGAVFEWLLVLKRRSLIPPKANEIVTERITKFDDRFDELWERSSKDYPIIIVRDSSYLNWRYSRYPFAGIDSFCVSRKGKLVGYAVTHSAIDEDGMQFVAILELYTPLDEKNCYKRLLWEIIRRSEKNGADYIMAKVSIPELKQIYKRYGFVLRQSQFSPYTYNNNANFPAEFVGNPDNWYISLGDGDMCFY